MLIPLEVTFPCGDGTQTLCPTLIADGGVLALVDCGYPGQLPLLEAAIRATGFSPEALTHVILTHHDDDHVGSLAALLRIYPQVQVLAGAKEAPYIDGRETSLRLKHAEALQPALPPELRDWGLQFQARLRSVEAAPVHQLLCPGQELPWCGGCRVVATPGHTPGHLSLFFPRLRTVITGDAAVAEHGAPAVANPQFALDLPQAEASLQALLALPADTYLCYHGGVFRRT
jgi:glyoxylase-like metal-dependent hydrolase (beta-lactamase superfamily II)